MSHEATHWAINTRGIEPAEKLILFFLADHHTSECGCEIGLADLSNLTEISEGFLQKHLFDLEAQGFIRLTSDERILLAFEEGFVPVDQRGVTP